MGVREEQAPFESEPQNVRVWSEGWVKRWMYCPRCGNQGLNRHRNNNPAADFWCASCAEEFELKSQRAKFGSKIVDGAFAAMSKRIEEKTNASLLLLQYDREDLQVRNLSAVPKHFFATTLLERRKPLSPTARRAGWVGCNILLGQLPKSGRIAVVEERLARPREHVLEHWRRLSFLHEESAAARGWLVEVMRCVEQIGRAEFTLTEVYAFEKQLERIYPNNSHVRQKVRQQLQVLRDVGYLEFMGRGSYRLLTPAGGLT